MKLLVCCLALVASSLSDSVVVSAADDSAERRVEDQTFVARCDGTEQRYVLSVPVSIDAKSPVTVLIALHGHGSDRWQFIRQPRDECRGVRDVAARRGLLLVSPDYRAKTSWMGPQAESDVVQIIQRLKAQFTVKHVVICGGSMGGTGALTFAARNPKLVDGVVALNGTADLVHYSKFPEAIAASFGGTRAELPDEYRARSALYFPERFTMPIASTTGGADTVVPPESVLELLTAVRRHNANVLSLHREQGGHSTDYKDTVEALEFVLDRIGMQSSTN